MASQILTVTALNFRALPKRLGAGLVIFLSVAGAVGVIVSVAALASSHRSLLADTGRPDRAIVVPKGATAEYASMKRDAAQAVLSADGVALDADGQPIASAEAVFGLRSGYRNGEKVGFIELRGIGPQGFALRPEIRLAEGRLFEPALHELVVGQRAQALFGGLDVGDRLLLPGGEWTVVGSFTSGGGQLDFSLLGNVDTLQSAFERPMFQSVTVRLADDGVPGRALDRLRAHLTASETLVDVYGEAEFLQMRDTYALEDMGLLVFLIGGLMAAGAAVAAINAMAGAVSGRRQEIATFRAIGFSPWAVTVAVLAEAGVLALAGGALGALLAWLAFDGTLPTVGFRMQVSVGPAVLAAGIAVAAGIGLLGGLFPALAAARLPVAIALRPE